MLSRLYQGRVTHHRRTPGHGFSYPVWYAWINLDEIDQFCRTSFWLSNERFNLISFYRQDYLPGNASLKGAVETLILERTGHEFSGDIYLLTTLRQLGYTMNPLSLYYCYGPGEAQPAYIVAEVHNTPWGERYTYVIESHGSKKLVQEKQFHVSPFMPMDLDYEFRLPAPGERLQVDIQLLEQSLPIFNASLDLQAQSLTSNAIRNLLISHGWQSVRTIARIYFQALRLWMKKATFFSHPSRQQNRSQDLRKSTS